MKNAIKCVPVGLVLAGMLFLPAMSSAQTAGNTSNLCAFSNPQNPAISELKECIKKLTETLQFLLQQVSLLNMVSPPAVPPNPAADQFSGISVTSPNGATYDPNDLIEVDWTIKGRMPADWPLDEKGRPNVAIDLYKGAQFMQLLYLGNANPPLMAHLISAAPAGNDYHIKISAYGSGNIGSKYSAVSGNFAISEGTFHADFGEWTASLFVDHDSLEFKHPTIYGSRYDSEKVSILSSAGVPLTWSVSVQKKSPWLQIIPQSGAIRASRMEIPQSGNIDVNSIRLLPEKDSFSVNVNSEGLSPGFYEDTLIVRLQTGNVVRLTKSVPVTLTVYPSDR